MPIFLDNASTTPIDPQVMDEMLISMKTHIGNPSSVHSEGRNARAEIEKSKNTIAELLGCSANEIIFTSGGTESNNQVFYSCLAFGNIKRVITSKIEHQSVLSTLLSLQKKFDFTLEFVEITENGDIDLDDLEKKISKTSQSLVSLMHGNNEIGNLLDLQTVGNLCQKYDALFHSDMVQTIGFYHFNLTQLPMDFVSFGVHKIHGPKGIGFLYIKNKKNIHPLIFGGGQQLGFRSGTENTPSIVGMRKALEIAYENLEMDGKYLQELKNHAIEKLQKAFPNLQFNGNCSKKNSLNKLLNISLPFKNDLLGFQLDLKGICVSQGSACSSGATKMSHVLEELYVKNRNREFTPLRISFSKYNTKAEIDFLVNSLLEISKF